MQLNSILKILLSFSLLMTFNSCSENSKYRNADYVFYQEDEKEGFWQKISANSDFKYGKGKLSYYFDNGNKFAELEVLDSFPNRIEKLYDKETSKLIKTVWKKGNLEYKRIYENGYYGHYYSNFGQIIIEEGLVENNLEKGIWKRYYNNNGAIKQIIDFKDGKKHGKRENFWTNGNLKNVSHWNMDKPIREVLQYHENGNVKGKNSIKNGKIHGLSKTYYSDGKLKSICNFWYAQSIDTCKKYYPNGNLKRLDITKLDTINLTSSGKVYIYYENGQLQKEAQSKNYTAHGIGKVYYENGNIHQQFNLINGVKNGKVKTFYETGELWSEGYAENNSFSGKIKYYDKNGRLEKTIVAENGVEIDSIIY